MRASIVFLFVTVLTHVAVVGAPVHIDALAHTDGKVAVVSSFPVTRYLHPEHQLWDKRPSCPLWHPRGQGHPVEP